MVLKAYARPARAIACHAQPLITALRVRLTITFQTHSRSVLPSACLIAPVTVETGSCREARSAMMGILTTMMAVVANALWRRIINANRILH